MSTSISLYQASVPMLVKSLRNLHVLLNKAEAFVQTKDNLTEKDMLDSRIIEDMLPFTFQIQTVCDTAKYLAVRVGGYPYVKHEDNEKTFKELHDRIDSTLDILNSLEPSCMDGDFNRIVTQETAKIGTYKYTAFDYVIKYTIPRFHMHLSTVYCLIRMQGAPINAFDYLDADKDLLVKV